MDGLRGRLSYRSRIISIIIIIIILIAALVDNGPSTDNKTTWVANSNNDIRTIRTSSAVHWEDVEFPHAPRAWTLKAIWCKHDVALVVCGNLRSGVCS